MEEIYAYHLTNKANIHSILLNGLVPSVGHNSRSVEEHHMLTYFTLEKNVNKWMQRFNFDKDETVLLKFSCSNYRCRYDSAGDYFTRDAVAPESIMVVGADELSLQDYYDANKGDLDLAENKRVVYQMNEVVSRLSLIEGKSLEAETSWEYNEVDPDVVKTIDLLSNLRSLDNKNDYEEIIGDIKTKTLSKLVANDLGITPESAVYKTVDMIFSDSMLENPKMSMSEMNWATILVGANLFERFVERWNRTEKKYGDDVQWQFGSFSFRDCPKQKFEELYSETENLNEARMSRHR